VDHSKLPQVTAGEAYGSERLKLGLNKALPEIGWLHNMHVAVEHFESSLGHTAIPLPMLSQFFITPSLRTNLDERYVPMLADPAIDTSDACPLIVLNFQTQKVTA
jgi:hypothetical protein